MNSHIGDARINKVSKTSLDSSSYSFYKIIIKSKSWLKKNKFLLLILIFYLVFNSLYLTRLPIFNDEAIYLDWGFVAAHWPGYLYQSMTDGKQPLMMWLFGIASNFSSDPLLSGRFVSVFLGGFSLVGLYLLAKTLFNEKVGLFTAIIFAITPIFVFYNRQALLESGLIFAIVWSVYYFLKFIQKPSNKNAILFGVFIGLGLFIKTTILLFVLPMTIIIIWHIISKKRTDLVTPSFISLGAFIAIDLLILINPDFWKALPANSRYSYTIIELIHFPIISWVNNLFGFLEIGLFYVTPILFILSFVGIFLIARTKKSKNLIFLIIFCLALLFEIFLTRTQSQRYLVPFLPFLAICIAYVLNIIWNVKKYQLLQRAFVSLIIILPLISSFYLMFNPYQYISKLSNYSKYSETAYIWGQTSGYGVNELVNFVKSETGSDIGYVFIALNAGNPENAIDVYSLKTDNILTFRMDSRLFPGIENYSCLSSNKPFFYIARKDQRSGMDRFLELKKTIPGKDNDYFINVYGLNKCEKVDLAVEDLYGPSIVELFNRKGIKHTDN